MSKWMILIAFVIYLPHPASGKDKRIDSLRNELNLQKKAFQSQDKQIDSLKNAILGVREGNLQQLIQAYQLTNDRINYHLSLLSTLAAVFGIIIAIAGIFIGFESIKSTRKREEAIETLQHAKEYVNNKKTEFETALKSKYDEFSTEYNGVLETLKVQLISQINDESLRVKAIVQEKSKEIEAFSISEASRDSFEKLNQRLEFFEKVGIPDDPKILLSKAKLLINENRHQEAITLCKRIISIDPNFASAYWHLGFEYELVEDYEESVANYKKYISIKPDDASAHNNLAVSLNRLKRTYDALKEYEIAISLAKTKTLYHRNRISVLKQLNSHDEVLSAYNTLIAIDKKDEKHYDEFYFYLLEQKKFENIIILMDTAIAELPKRHSLSNLRKSQALFKLGRHEERIAILKGLISAGYQSDICYKAMAESLIQIGDKKAAIETLNQAIALNAKYTSHYIQLARIAIQDDNNLAYKIIVDGAKSNGNASLFQEGAKLFTNSGIPSYADKFHNEGIDFLVSKQTKDESDFLNLVELFILSGKLKEAKKAIEQDVSLKDTKYEIISMLITDCITLLDGKPLDKLKYEQFKELDRKGLDWNFDDLITTLQKASVSNDVIEGYRQLIQRFSKK